jgi:hypothetical protein
VSSPAHLEAPLCDCPRCVPADDLIETLVSAASDAIRNQAPALTCDVGRVRGLHLELELANNGAVVDSVCWIERRGVHRRTGG